ncbi:MAG: hypothetical protein UY18_C0042G0003 [Microgenomates group bacterium GW2011_GWF2_47_9]|nr:MAG: hypothetical protein UY18_C0042G0003 [Microgenomates group bacterium GW2011_GWF2_47_9]
MQKHIVTNILELGSLVLLPLSAGFLMLIRLQIN